MGVRDVGFRIKIPLSRETSETQKALEKQKKTLVGMQKQDLPRLTKTTKEYLKSAKTSFGEVDAAAQKMGRSFASSMSDGLRGLNKLDRGLSSLRGKLINIKTVLAGTAVGVGAAYIGKTLYEQGKQQLATFGRIKREFGEGESAKFATVATAAGKKAGLGDDDTIKALIPFRERLDDIEAGAQFRGMKKKLTATQATALRDKNLAFGANMLSRVATLAPEVDASEAGSVLADALSGPEGVKRLVSVFNLSKQSKTVAAANEKGDVFKLLRDEEKKKYGITKKGQYLEQGDLVNVLLERSGLTEGAAEAKRKKFDFQIKAIGAMAEDALGDIGARALDKFNGGIAKGSTLAEKFENALKSKEGQKVLDSVSNAVVGIAEGAVKVATTLPKIGSFLSEHKSTLTALGAGFLGLKAMSALGGKGGPGAAGGIAGLLGAAGKPIPVYIVGGPGGGGVPGLPGGAPTGLKPKDYLGAAPALVTALTGGYALGTELDNWLGLSDKISKGIFKTDQLALGGEQTAKNELSVARVIMARVAAGKETGTQAAEEFKRFASSAEGKGKDQLSEVANKLAAILAAQKPAQVIVDGRVLAEITSAHQERAIKAATANGAAPFHRE